MGLEAFAIDAEPEEETEPRYCACGCGEVLTSKKWSYKRGHKLAAAATEIEDDPDNLDTDSETSTSSKNQPVRMTAKLRRDIEGTIGFFLGLGSDLVTTVDPICGNAVQQQVEALAAALTPLACKNATLVRVLTKADNMKAWIGLYAAAKPIAITVAQHHFTHKIGDAESADQSYYVIPEV